MSLHYVAEVITLLHWNRRVADHIGRKPVHSCCLAGTAISMVMFGFSRSFRMIFFSSTPTFDCAICLPAYPSRCLNGVMKGNIGVVKNAMAKLTDETNMARGYASLQVAWAVGYVIGSDILLMVPCLR
jgi:MFS family permease